MSAQISGIVREESPNNYKHVVMTMIGSVAEFGFHSNSVTHAIFEHSIIPRQNSRVTMQNENLTKKPSIFLGSRCLWNEVTDSFTSIRYSNSTLYCVVLIYALFYQKN